MDFVIKKVVQIIMNFINGHGSKKMIPDKPPTTTDEFFNTEDVHIRRDITIRNKFVSGWKNKARRSSEIEDIVIHGTAGGNSVNGMLEWMYNGGRGKYYKKGIGLFHYLIGLDGEIVEVIDPNYWVYHSHSGSHAKKEIGIELINTERGNTATYTENQYLALFNLIFTVLTEKYPINRIIAHQFNAATHAKIYGYICPGNFDWNKLRNYAEKYGYRIENIDKKWNLAYSLRNIRKEEENVYKEIY